MILYRGVCGQDVHFGDAVRGLVNVAVVINVIGHGSILHSSEANKNIEICRQLDKCDTYHMEECTEHIFHQKRKIRTNSIISFLLVCLLF